MNHRTSSLPPLITPAPLKKIAQALRQGQEDIHAQLDLFCERVRTIDPHIQAFLPDREHCERLHAQAEALAQRIPDPVQRPPLFGIPVGVKDIFHVEGFVTRAGSQLPPDELAGPEAECVRLLRAAGALVMGKTVTTEFAYFAPGPTRNPHNLQHTPGGSSSGSAAAVAAGMVPLALGSQTIGSIIRPAAFCGIVGFKPTYQRIPSEGILYFSRSLDHVGLFTQDVAGMCLAASLLCSDWVEKSWEHRPVLALPTGPYLEQASAEALDALDAQVQRLQKAGYTILRIPLFSDIAEINRRHRLLAAYEFAQEHAVWFASFASLYRPQTIELIRAGQQADPKEIQDIRADRALIREGVEHVMDVHDIDFWICPAALGTAPLGIDSTGNPIMNLPWTYTGLPAVTVPAGFAPNGLPLGLQIIGHWREDEGLLAGAENIAVALQQ